MGQLFREARESLGLSVTAFAAEAGVPRTYVHDVEAGRKFVNRPVVDAISRLAPPMAASLSAQFEEFSLRRMWRKRRPLALLAQELLQDVAKSRLPDSLPYGRQPTMLPGVIFPVDGHGPAESLALSLLQASRLQPDPNIILSRVPVQLTANFDCQAAVIEALRAGADCLHIVEWSDDVQQQAAALRQGLNFIGTPGRYRMVLSERRAQIPSFIGVGGVGALEFFLSDARDIASAVFFPFAGPTAEVATVLSRQAHTAEQVGSSLLAEFRPVTERPDRDSGAILKATAERIRLEIELMSAELRGDRFLVRDGFEIGSIPPEVAIRQASAWKRQLPIEAGPLVDVLVNTRRQRWSALRGSTASAARDICTKNFIESYLGPDYSPEWVYQSEYLGYEIIPWRDRQAHVRAIIELVAASTNSYSLGLVDTPDGLPGTVDGSYWQAAGDSVVIVSTRGSEYPPLFLSIRAPEIVDAFKDLAEVLWDELPPDGRDQGNVVRWLESALDRAESAL